MPEGGPLCREWQTEDKNWKGKTIFALTDPPKQYVFEVVEGGARISQGASEKGGFNGPSELASGRNRHIRKVEDSSNRQGIDPETEHTDRKKMEVNVINNQVEQAMQKLKRLLIKEGMFKELKKRRYYAKPSVYNKLKREEAEKNRHKERKRAMARSRNFL